LSEKGQFLSNNVFSCPKSSFWDGAWYHFFYTMLTLHALFFGHYRDFTPDGRLTLELPEGATIADLATVLANRDPRFADLLERVRVAVGAAFVLPDMVLKNGDEVAFLPPMSGG
jgi:molybdopterin synthase sulfur carrier subunit